MRVHHTTADRPRPRTLRARGVTVHFDGVTALENADVWIDRGEIVGLIGPNGAGKTTLINVLSGFQACDAGTVALDDDDITGMAPERLAEMGLGRTFQAVRLFGELTADENVILGALGVGIGARQAAPLGRKVLDALGLKDVRHHKASELPQGTQRMVGVARALASAPGIILLDEPAAGLNEEESEELSRRLQKVGHLFDVGILVIEHDMRLIMGLCERIHVLDYGRMIAVGSPIEVQRTPAVLTAYLGSSESRIGDEGEDAGS